LDQAKCLGLVGIYNGGGGSSVQSLEYLVRNLSVQLEEFSVKLDVIAEEIKSCTDAMQRLLLAKLPLVLVEEEAGGGGASSLMPRKEDRDGGTSDVADSVHMDGNG
jgi:hypothetical protein